VHKRLIEQMAERAAQAEEEGAPATH
jgi:hypothetical protein